MYITDRHTWERAQRVDLIIAAARDLAEAERREAVNAVSERGNALA